LSYGKVDASDNNQLIPIRQVMLFRDKLKLQDDANMSAEEKTKRIGEIDAKLAELEKQVVTN
jgi:phosphonate transport system substrate-binding protein